MNPLAEAFRPEVWRQAGRDTAYLLVTLPISIASFTVLVTGLSLAAGLLVVVVGVPVAAATLLAAQGFGRLERARLGAAGTTLPPVRYAPTAGLSWRDTLTVLADPLRWAAVVHGVGAMALSIVTWTVAVTWWAGAAGGLTYWFWSRWPPSPDLYSGLPELLRLPVPDSVFYLVLGAVFALTLPAVSRGCVRLHAGWARLLLTGTSSAVLAAEVRSLEVRRTSAAEAEAQELRRLERDIHDGPQQRLLRLGMDLATADRLLTDDPAAARDLLTAARAQTAETLAELRALSRGIAPPVLADRGLAAALAGAAGRCPVPVSLDVRLADGPRPGAAVENAAYFTVTEALANVVKHAEASRVTVSVAGSPAAGVRVEVGDDGRGGATVAEGHGLAGLAHRVEGLGGRLTMDSPAGGPTTLVAQIPWA
jgi:signal transduction histidine kinase